MPLREIFIIDNTKKTMSGMLISGDIEECIKTMIASTWIKKAHRK